MYIKVRDAVKPDINIRIDGSMVSLAALHSYANLAVLKNLSPHRKILSSNLKLFLCYLFIMSRLSYGNIVYAPTLLSRDTNWLQRLQNSCFRFAFGIRKCEQEVSAIFADPKDLKTDCFRS